MPDDALLPPHFFMLAFGQSALAYSRPRRFSYALRRSLSCEDSVSASRRALSPQGHSFRATFGPLERYAAMSEDFTVRPPRVLNREQRLARDAKRRADAEEAMREAAARRKAFDENRKRLRAERLAREALASRE